MRKEKKTKMKCPRAHELIGELLEEAIGDGDRRELEKHLESCSECRDLLADFRNIKTQAAALPRLEPSSDVWPAILSGIRRARRAGARSSGLRGRLDWLFLPGRPRYAFAATLALLAVVGGLVLVRGSRPPAVPPAGNGDAFTLAKLEEAETHYRLAIQALSEAAAGQKSLLDAETHETMQRDLRAIDSVIAACLEAVRKNPRNVDARVYLLGAYRGKVDFLDAVIAAKKSSAAPSAADIIL
ncbi:MAG: zf-HC2 domain-containing protein [Candidatus Aminicenantes bacterium]|nr:zf-HC2 domain-containing protein [Candidatus Aminicenantes bacterium]